MSLSDVTAIPLLTWLFNPYVVGTISLVLVAAGSAMVLRDVLRNRRKLSTHFTPATPTHSAPNQPNIKEPAARPALVGVPAAGPSSLARPATQTPQPFQQLAAAIASVHEEIATGDAEDGVPRDPSMEGRWQTLQARLDRVICDVQPVLASVRVTVSQPGEPRWGLANRSYGTYRRISLDGTSVGWLRAEITAEGTLRFRVRAHQPSMAHLNAEGDADVGRLDTPELTRALTAAFLPAARYAAWNVAKANATGSSDQPLSHLIDEAIDIANGALVEARATLTRRAEPGTHATSPQEVMLAVLVDRRQVALMRLNEVDGGIDVSVGVPDPKRLDLTRRQSLPRDRLAAYDLAEAMATCAWPALAHALGSVAAPGGQTNAKM